MFLGLCFFWLVLFLVFSSGGDFLSFFSLALLDLSFFLVFLSLFFVFFFLFIFETGEPAVRVQGPGPQAAPLTGFIKSTLPCSAFALPREQMQEESISGISVAENGRGIG